jgi:hypothetical protein
MLSCLCRRRPLLHPRPRLRGNRCSFPSQLGATSYDQGNWNAFFLRREEEVKNIQSSPIRLPEVRFITLFQFTTWRWRRNFTAECLAAKRADHRRNGRITAYMDIRLWHTGPEMIIAAKTTTILSMVMKSRYRVRVFFLLMSHNYSTTGSVPCGKISQLSVFKILFRHGARSHRGTISRTRRSGSKSRREVHHRAAPAI